MQNLLIILLSFPLLINGQNKTIESSNELNNSFWYKKNLILSNRIHLDTIKNSKNEWHFRFGTDKLVIDIWKSPIKEKYGKLTLWTKEYVPYNEEDTDRYFYKSKKLDSTLVNKIILLIDSSEINNIPTDKLINGWNKGHDGITYIIETKNLDMHNFKTYWTPKAQNSLLEAKKVQSFIDQISKLIDYQETWNNFNSLIPFQSYSNNGYTIYTKALTLKEQRKFKRERKKYRKQKYSN